MVLKVFTLRVRDIGRTCTVLVNSFAESPKTKVPFRTVSQEHGQNTDGFPGTRWAFRRISRNKIAIPTDFQEPNSHSDESYLGFITVVRANPSEHRAVVNLPHSDGS